MYKSVSLLLPIGITCFLTSCLPGTSSENASAKQTKPNILIILADDLGYNDVSFMGSKFYETPHLDELANKSYVFTNAYSNSRVCSPSRASIMNGKFTARHGITDFLGAKTEEDWREHGRHDRMLPAYFQRGLSDREITLTQVIKDAGYITYFAGKWHLGNKGKEPTKYGFDFNVGGYNSGSPRGGYFSPYNNPALNDGPEGENLTMRLADETSTFIRHNKDTPFFAFLSFYAVHGPIETTQAKWQKYQDKVKKRGAADRGFEMGDVLPYRLHQDNPVYAGLVSSMDDAIGRVLQTLKDEGLDEKTIVIFTSDNGGVVSGDSYSTNLSPLRGGKGHPREGGIRVPFCIYNPLDKRGGSQVKIDAPAIGSDIFPTILELTGNPLLPEVHVDGVSLAPLMRGEKSKERSLIWHYPHYGNQGGKPSSIIRKGEWKLIHFYETDHLELYNLDADISETTNLVDSLPALAASLHQELTDYLQSVSAKYPTVDPSYSPEDRLKWEKKIKNELLTNLEKERKGMLDDSFKGKDNWWGSED